MQEQHAAIEEFYGPCPQAYYTGRYTGRRTLQEAGIDDGKEAEWWSLGNAGEYSETVWLIWTGYRWRVATDQEYIAIEDALL